MGLEIVETEKWGGLMLTLVVGVTGLVASFPIGIVLALGRQSVLPVIRIVSTTFIEVWRGVPLITVLFMALVMLPLFLPKGLRLNELALALTGIVTFSGAYLAEVVRGGLQAIPEGQYEAARALGFGYWKTTLLVILPQALEKVVPAIVNYAIALFKDTTLVMIVGLFDLLNIVSAGAADPRWLGSSAEGYVFVALVFWIFLLRVLALQSARRAPIEAGPDVLMGGDMEGHPPAVELRYMEYPTRLNRPALICWRTSTMAGQR